MKKIAMILVLAGFLAGSLMAQEGFPDLKRYFMLANQLTSPDYDFKKRPLMGDDPADNKRFSNLTENLEYIDSYLEFALITYYSTAEKPWAERGNAVLPLNNPRLVDRQLGAYVYKELVILRFLNDTAAVNRHEAVLQFITGRGNVTRAEIETYYRNNIAKLVSDTVDEEFNKTNIFMIDRNYNAVLTRDPQTGQYILSYEDVNNVVKKLSAVSLKALSLAMSNSSDFSSTAFNEVSPHAEQIPAVIYAELKAQKAYGGADAPALIKETITNFYLDMNNKEKYNAVLGIYARYYAAGVIRGASISATAAYHAFVNTLQSLSEGLLNKSKKEVETQDNAFRLARYPADSRFDVFSHR